MTLINITKGSVVCEKVIQANSLKEKNRGLIGSDGAHGIYLKTRWGIHTFGMKFPIDVVVLDTQWIVVQIKKNLKPNTIFFWNPKYAHIVEIPSRIAGNIDLGNKLELREI